MEANENQVISFVIETLRSTVSFSVRMKWRKLPKIQRTITTTQTVPMQHLYVKYMSKPGLLKLLYQLTCPLLGALFSKQPSASDPWFCCTVYLTWFNIALLQDTKQREHPTVSSPEHHFTSLPHHWRVINEGVQVPHVAVHQSPDVLHLRAQVLVGSVGTQHADPKQKHNHRHSDLSRLH